MVDGGRCQYGEFRTVSRPSFLMERIHFNSRLPYNAQHTKLEVGK